MMKHKCGKAEDFITLFDSIVICIPTGNIVGSELATYRDILFDDVCGAQLTPLLM